MSVVGFLFKIMRFTANAKIQYHLNLIKKEGGVVRLR